MECDLIKPSPPQVTFSYGVYHSKRDPTRISFNHDILSKLCLKWRADNTWRIYPIYGKANAFWNAPTLPPPTPLPPCLALSPLYCVVTSLRPVPHFDFSMASLKTFNTGCDFGGPSPTVHPSLYPLPFLFPDHFLLWAASSKLSSSLSSVPLLLLDRVKNELRYC